MVATFTPTTNVDAIPTIVANETIRLLPSYMGMAKFVSKDTDWTGQDFRSYGDTLDIVKPGAFTAREKTPGTPVTVDNASSTKVSVSLDTWAYVAMLQEDITKMLQKPDLQAEYARRQAIVIAEKIETKLMQLHTSATNTYTFNISSETNTVSSMLGLRSRFARLKVPKSEEKMLFADTSVIDAILDCQKFSSRDYVEDKALMEGAVKRVLGINVFETQLVQSTGSPVAWHNMALTRYGMVLANRPLPLDGNGLGVQQVNMTDPNTGLAFRMTRGYDNDNKGVRFDLECLFGVALCDQNQVIEVESF